MTELSDIEESIRYSCRKNPMYGDELIRRIKDKERIVNEITEFIRGQKLTDRVSVDVIDSIIFPRNTKEANSQ